MEKRAHCKALRMPAAAVKRSFQVMVHGLCIREAESGVVMKAEPCLGTGTRSETFQNNLAACFPALDQGVSAFEVLGVDGAVVLAEGSLEYPIIHQL